MRREDCFRTPSIFEIAWNSPRDEIAKKQCCGSGFSVEYLVEAPFVQHDGHLGRHAAVRAPVVLVHTLQPDG